MKLKNKIKFGIPVLVLGSLTFLGITRNQQTDEPEPQKKTIVKTPRVKNPKLRIAYNTDTIEHRQPILLYNQNGKIYRYYKKGDRLYGMRLFLFVHEAWHTHNNDLGYRRYKYSPLQYRKLLIHDEISASLAALNSLILEYSFSENKPEFLKNCLKNRSFPFYFKEVAAGNIDPLSTNPEMKEKDLSFRVNGMIEVWLRRHYKSYYERHKRIVFNYIQLNGLNNENPITYNKMLYGMYKIGGIDFWKYVKKDIQVNDFSLMNNLAKVKSFSKKNRVAVNEIKKYIPLFENISDTYQSMVALQHLIISSEIKAQIISNNYEVDEQITNILYNKIQTAHSKDETFTDFAKESSLLNKKYIYKDNEPYFSLDDFIEKVYTYKGVNLAEKIKDFTPENVPYNATRSFFANTENFDIFNWNTYNESLFAHIQDPEKPTAVTSQKQKNEQKPRRSAVQYVEIPNFWEPILVCLTPKQEQELKKVYADFYDLPATKEFSEATEPKKNQKSR